MSTLSFLVTDKLISAIVLRQGNINMVYIACCVLDVTGIGNLKFDHYYPSLISILFALYTTAALY